MPRYSVLTYNFNNYEILREPREMDPECEYIYVTDNPEYAGQTRIWKVVVADGMRGLSPFDKCYRVRFDLFRYVSTPVCIYLDGSLQINKSLRKLYDAFMASGADVGLNIHPTRDNVLDEYATWIATRGYDTYQRDKCLCMMRAASYDPLYKGLYQGTLRICRDTDMNARIDRFVLDTLVRLGTWGTIERLDQTIYSFIVNKFFPDINIFPVSSQVLQSDYLSWCAHEKPDVYPYNKDNDKPEVYVLGELRKPYFI